MTVGFDSVGRGRGDSCIDSIDARKHKLNLKASAVLVMIGSNGSLVDWGDATPPVINPTYYPKLLQSCNLMLEGFARVGVRIRLGIVNIFGPTDTLDFNPGPGGWPDETIRVDIPFQPVIAAPGDITEWAAPWAPLVPQGTVNSDRIGPTVADWSSAFEKIRLGFPFGFNKTSTLQFHFGLKFLGSQYATGAADEFQTDLLTGFPVGPDWNWDQSSLSKFLGVSVNNLGGELQNLTPLGSSYLSDTYGSIHVINNNDDINEPGRAEDEWGIRGRAFWPFQSPLDAEPADMFYAWIIMWGQLRFTYDVSPIVYLPPPQNLTATSLGGSIKLDFASGELTEVNHSIAADPFAVIYSDDLAKMNHAQAIKIIGFQTGDVVPSLTPGTTYYFAVISLLATFLLDESISWHGNLFDGADASNGPLSNIASAVA